ncbi:MAG: hypothetical protein R3D34_17255 [Nitratireductor sp.]
MTTRIGNSSSSRSGHKTAGVDAAHSGGVANGAASSRFQSSIDASRSADVVTERQARPMQPGRPIGSREKPVVYHTQAKVTYREALESMVRKPSHLSAMIERGKSHSKMLDIAIVAKGDAPREEMADHLPVLAGGMIFMTAEQHHAWRSGEQDAGFEKALADLMMLSLQDSLNW